MGRLQDGRIVHGLTTPLADDMPDETIKDEEQEDTQDDAISLDHSSISLTYQVLARVCRH